MRADPSVHAITPQVTGSVKLCITAEGHISAAKLLKSTGFAAYDEKMLTAVREWRYRPFQVDGKRVPVCTSLTFTYHEKLPPSSPPQPPDKHIP